MNSHILFNHDDKFISFQSLLTSRKPSFYVSIQERLKAKPTQSKTIVNVSSTTSITPKNRHRTDSKNKNSKF